MNKKILSLVALAALLGTGCDKETTSITQKENNIEEEKDNEEKEHIHTYKKEWSNDENNHWHDSTCGHDVKNDFQGHVFGDTQIADDGSKYVVCSICSFKKITEVPHEHTYSDTFKYDDEYHWQQATCHPDEKRNYTKHDFGNEIRIDKNGNAYQLCSVCNYKKAADTDNNNLFKVTTDFYGNVLSHTDDQMRFIQSMYFQFMSSNEYPDGKENLSSPNFTKLDWNYTGNNDVVTFSVSISQYPDMKDSFDIIGDSKKTIDLYNLYLGYNYFRINAIHPNGKIDKSNIHEMYVQREGTRNLYVGATMTNCRDIGGREITYDDHIKQGLLYKICGNGYFMDNKKIDDEGKNILRNHLKIKTEINVHSDDSFNFNLENTKVFNTHMDYENKTSKNDFSRNTESIKNVFEILADKNNYPICIHDRVSHDRAQLVVNLLYGLLGIEEDKIYEDYLFNNFGKLGFKCVPKTLSNITNGYMNELRDFPGRSFGQSVYNALRSIGVPKATIDKILDIYIDGEKPIYEEEIYAGIKDMELKNTQSIERDKSSLTDILAPENTATLNSTTTVKISFNLTKRSEYIIYLYLGSKDYSDSKTMNSSLSLIIDNQPVAVSRSSYKEAGMGYCGTRTNFYLVKINEDFVFLDLGQHILTIKGTANDSLILSGVSVLAW